MPLNAVGRATLTLRPFTVTIGPKDEITPARDVRE